MLNNINNYGERLVGIFQQISYKYLFISALLILGAAPAYAGIFQIDTLTSDNSVTIEHEPITGDDRGGIAISNSHVFYRGDDSVGRFNIADLSGGTNINANYDGLTSDLATGQVYVLGSGATTAYPNGSSTITHLLEVNGATGALTGVSITLSSSFTVSDSDRYIFAGHERIVYFDGFSALNIDLPSGLVTNLGAVSLDSPHECENSIDNWGVAEYDGTDVSLVYISNSGPGTSIIIRTNVTTGTHTTAASFPNGLDDMCSFTVSIPNNRWYFHWEYSSGTFGGGDDENLGFADATFTVQLTESESEPIPSMSVWGLGILAGLLGFIGIRRKMKVTSALS